MNCGGAKSQDSNQEPQMRKRKQSPKRELNLHLFTSLMHYALPSRLAAKWNCGTEDVFRMSMHCILLRLQQPFFFLAQKASTSWEAVSLMYFWHASVYHRPIHHILCSAVVKGSAELYTWSFASQVFTGNIGCGGLVGGSGWVTGNPKLCIKRHNPSSTGSVPLSHCLSQW